MQRTGASSKKRVPREASVAGRLAYAAARAFAALAILAGFGHGSAATAQETQQQFRYEADEYVKLDDMFRFRFIEYVTRATEASPSTKGHFEVDLDIGLKPVLRTKLRNLPDTHRGKYLFLRVGYAYIPTFNDGKEHEIVLEATARFPLSRDILLSDRSRGDLMWKNGVFSTRYRNRLMLERDFEIRSVKITPYFTAEAYYDLSDDLWDRFEFSPGVELPLGKRPVIEFYYLRRNNSHQTVQHMNRLGVAFQYYF